MLLHELLTKLHALGINMVIKTDPSMPGAVMVAEFHKDNYHYRYYFAEEFFKYNDFDTAVLHILLSELHKFIDYIYTQGVISDAETR